MADDTFVPEMHLKQHGFTYNDCGPVTKNKESIETFMQTGNTGFIYRNKLDTACFEHNMAYGKFSKKNSMRKSFKTKSV